MTPKKILIIRFSSLGDILLTFPVYKNLKEMFPNSEITVLTKPQFIQILSAAKYADKVMPFYGISKTVSDINSYGFDLIIDLHSNLRSFLVSSLSRANIKIRYKKDSIWRRIFVNWKIITPSLQKHTVDRYLDCLKQIGLENPSKELFIGDFKSLKPEKEEKKLSFLLIQTAFLGDSLLSLPLVKAIKENFPNSKLTVLIRAENKQVFSGISEIDEIIEDNKKSAPKISEFTRLLKELKKRHFDAALIPHRSFRSALLASLAGIPKRIGFNFGFWSFLFTDAQPFGWPMHDAERNMMLLSALKVLSKPSFPDFEQKEELPEEIKKIPLKIAINPSSVWETKRWPKEYFVSLIKKIKESYKIPCLITGGKAEEEYNLEIEKSLPEGYCINLTGKTGLSSLVSLIKNCDLFVTNDSGPMHIAAALGTPLIAIFGPTTKELGFFPYSKQAVVLEEELKCRPCRLHGSRKCPHEHFLCMRLITPQKVFNEISKIVKYKP
ncbi:MAG: lipopolysaccharide heptosyltransferase II [Elusimicrobiota bacterium]